jgi:hypothetical protein
MACTEKDLRPLAMLAYSYLKGRFQANSNFWKLGHSFDTIIDYFLLGSDYSTDASDFGSIAVAAYGRSKGCWYDDFGWWGIAALRASQHPKIFGVDSPPSFKKITNFCWQTMDDNAPYVWDNNGSNPAYKVLQPRFQGGVWNRDWSRPDGCGGAGAPPGIPRVCGGDNTQAHNLPGIQNTVTNGLYLVLASRLGQLDKANREYGFLNEWFNVQDPAQSLLNRLEYGVLVRERVGTYGGEGYLPVCGYDHTLAWAGDQGLILGGAVEMASVGPDPQASLKLAQDIAWGVKLASQYCNGGILQAWVSGDGGDPSDYLTGVAVYMRYLLYAYQNNPSMQSYLKDTGYVDFVCKNASEINEDRLQADNVWDPANPDKVLVYLTNDLAILVAAIAMSRT